MTFFSRASKSDIDITLLDKFQRSQKHQATAIIFHRHKDLQVTKIEGKQAHRPRYATKPYPDRKEVNSHSRQRQC